MIKPRNLKPTSFNLHNIVERRVEGLGIWPVSLEGAGLENKSEIKMPKNCALNHALLPHALRAQFSDIGILFQLHFHDQKVAGPESDESGDVKR